MNEAVSRKLRKYGARFEAENLVYMPVTIDTLGGWHPLAQVSWAWCAGNSGRGWPSCS